MGAGRHTTRRAGKRVRAVLVALALVAAVVVAGWGALRVFGGEVGNATDECGDAAVISLSVVPELEDLVSAAVEAATDPERCTQVRVVAQTADELTAEIAAGGRYDLWIPDSMMRVQRLAAAGTSASPVSVGLASSPVGLASGPSADRPASWAAAMASGRVALGDPGVDGPSAVALLGPLAERSATGADDQQARTALVSAAQAYGARAIDGDVESVDLSTVGPTTSALVPVTEAQFLAHRKGNDALSLVTPRTGAVLMTYPLVSTQGSSAAALGLGRNVAAWFGTVEARRQLAAAGFRSPAGTPLEGGIGMAGVTTLEMPADEAVEAMMASWQVLSAPSSLLAVFDSSGSMDFTVGDGTTRMQLAVDAARTALDVLPTHARVGMWAFSIDQGGPGQDWRQLAPVRPLSEPVRGGRTQYDLLQSRVPILLDITRGGTGLYDTTLAAYRAAVQQYDDRYFNSVILLTDGANDDPGSISLEQLLATLADENDPGRPVRIIAVGISEDADLGALQRIAGATGGKAYVAQDPRDILGVFAQALLGR